MQTIIEHRDILFFSTMKMTDLPTRKQRIASILAENNRVVYVDPPVTMLGKMKAEYSRSLPDLPEGNGLTTLDLPVLWPFGLKYPLFHTLNELRVAHTLARWCKKNHFHPTLLWTYLVDFPGVYETFQDAVLVYDCVDDHAVYGGLRSKDYIRQLENRLLKNADVCFCTSAILRERLSKVKPDVQLITNGVDLALFQNPSTSVPEDIASIPKPIFGYFGAIKSWFDIDLIKQAALQFPTYSFVLVGPYDEAIRKQADTLPNIHWLGKKEYAAAPSYIRQFDVCMIPFLQNELTLSVSPLKFYEYMAMGKPVISIPMEQLLPYASDCVLYKDQEQFLRYLPGMLLDNETDKVTRRKQIAQSNDWQLKFTTMFTSVNQRGGSFDSH
ncbi:glycosyltransferase [bacterium]|nr:glycosyltransferase [bacterium]